MPKSVKKEQSDSRDFKKIGKKKLIIIACIFIVFTFILVITLTIIFLRLKDKSSDSDTESHTSDTSTENIEPEVEDRYSAYPDLEQLIGKSLEEVEEVYPEGEVIKSKTTDGRIYTSYMYENDLFILYVDGKETGIIDSTTLTVKEMEDCVLDETILDYVDEVVPYAHFDPREIGSAYNIGIATGLASFYDYKDGYIISVTCHITLHNDFYFSVTYFDNPNE